MRRTPRARSASRFRNRPWSQQPRWARRMGAERRGSRLCAETMPRYKGAQFITNPRIKNKYGLENGAFGDHQPSLTESSHHCFAYMVLVQSGPRTSPPLILLSSPLFFHSQPSNRWQNIRSGWAAGPKRRLGGNAQLPLLPSRPRENNLSRIKSSFSRPFFVPRVAESGDQGH